MMGRIKRGLSPSLIVAMLAVVFASVGGASAATGADDAPTASKASNVSKAAVRGPRGPRGPRGKTGKPGPQGPQGPQGSPGFTAIRTVDGARGSLPPNSSVESFEANCPAGTVVIGTGYYNSITEVAFVKKFGLTKVVMAAFNDSSITVDELHAQAICAEPPPGYTFQKVDPDAIKRQIAKAVAEVERARGQ